MSDDKTIIHVQVGGAFACEIPREQQRRVREAVKGAERSMQRLLDREAAGGYPKPGPGHGERMDRFAESLARPHPAWSVPWCGRQTADPRFGSGGLCLEHMCVEHRASLERMFTSASAVAKAPGVTPKLTIACQGDWEPS